MKRSPVLVHVVGGVAEVYANLSEVDVRVVDVDNIKAGEGPVELPVGCGFEALCEEAFLEAPFVKFEAPIVR